MGNKKKNGKRGGHQRQWSLSAEVDPILIPEGQRGQQPDGGQLSGSHGGLADSSPLTLLSRRMSGRFTGNGGSRAIPIAYSQQHQNHHSRTLSESRQSGLKIFNNFSPNTFHPDSPSAAYGRPLASSFKPILNAGRSPSAGLGYSYSATPQGQEGPLTEEQVARILSGHLVQKEAGEQPPDFGTVSHSLLGGETSASLNHFGITIDLGQGKQRGPSTSGKRRGTQ